MDYCEIKTHSLNGNAATVEICESNTVSETITHGISNSNWGSADEANTDNTAHPITAGNRSYAKYQRFHVTNMGASTSILALKVWRTTSLSGSDTHVTNARTSSYGGAASFATPVTSAITGADQTMPTSAPATNLGIGGSLSGALTATGYSDYLIHQIVTDSGTVAGASTTMHYQYDEIA